MKSIKASVTGSSVAPLITAGPLALPCEVLISQSGQLGLGNELSSGCCSRTSPLLLLHLWAFLLDKVSYYDKKKKKDIFGGWC